MSKPRHEFLRLGGTISPGRYLAIGLLLTLVKVGLDYVVATIKSGLAPPNREHSFEEWGVRNLGRTLYDLAFGIYSARVWGLPTSQISSKLRIVSASGVTLPGLFVNASATMNG